MKNLNFWSKFFILNFWSSRCSRPLKPCTKWRGKIKSMSFHQCSWNSEVETTWISLIGWHHKTSNMYVLGMFFNQGHRNSVAQENRGYPKFQNQANVKQVNSFLFSINIHFTAFRPIVSTWKMMLYFLLFY